MEETDGRLDVKFLTSYSKEFAQFHSAGNEDEELNNIKSLPSLTPRLEDTPDVRIQRLHNSIEQALAAELLDQPEYLNGSTKDKIKIGIDAMKLLSRATGLEVDGFSLKWEREFEKGTIRFPRSWQELREVFLR